MNGYPYNYGDELSEEEAIENFKAFLKNYGPTICVNGLLILLSTSAYAVDKPGTVKPGSGEAAPAPKPTPAPVFTRVIPPLSVVHTKAWGMWGITSITWLCLTAASTGNPALIVACSSLILYAIGAKP